MSRVIFKMTFMHPNLKDSTNKNVAHINYIATRSGVDKSITEKDLEKELQKGIDKSVADDETYLKYINERPRSHGLFGADGLEDIEAVKKEISECQSYIWRGIISLREEDAKNLDYLGKDKWQDLLRKKIPDIATEMGIRVTNLRWSAAIHMERGHPHAHIMFWENTPERALGVVRKSCLENIRKSLTDEVFEDERFQLMNEKDTMRDLIRDLAKGDVGKAAQIIKEVRATGLELKALMPELNMPGVPPKMYLEDEIELAEKIKKLADMLPGKGRVMLKFMPEDVKAEVRAIADYLLQQPEFSASLAKNLRAIEEMASMYTGKEEDIQKARGNAYNDIRDRVCQIILRGAAESQKDNVLYIDDELAATFVTFVQNMRNQINLIPERVAVLNQMAVALLRTGHTDENISSILTEFSEKNSLNLTNENIPKLINELKENGAAFLELNMFSSSKEIDFMLSTLKLAGYNEGESFSILREAISKDARDLEQHLNELKQQGYLIGYDDTFQLTKKGIDEFLSTKTLDAPQKAILAALEKGEKDYNQLIDDKSIFGSLYNKDPDEFMIGKYDLKVREEFGDNNRITMKELETNIYERYQRNGTEDMDKADREFDILKKRIEKLCLNGYVEFNKESGLYSFTEEGIQELGNISDRMEFTRYDASVTLSYIDKAEKNLLRTDDLRNMLEKEVVNKQASFYYGRFTELLDNKNAKEFIHIDEQGNISATDQGKSLTYEMQNVIRYFNEAKGPLTEDALKDMCNKEFKGMEQQSEAKYQEVIKNIKELVGKGTIEELKDGSFLVNPMKQDVKNLLYQVYREGGYLRRDSLKDILEKNIPNQEAEQQYKYLIKRLENLKKEGYVTGGHREYTLNDLGIEKRADLLTPEREYLRKEIKFLKELGFTQPTDDGYDVTVLYKSYMEQASKDSKSGIFRPEIIKLIDKSYDSLSTGKIERFNQRIAVGKYINNEFQQLPSDYSKFREFCNVEDTVAKSIHRLTTALLVSGINIEDTKNIIHQWNIGSQSYIDPEKMNEAIEKAHNVVKDNQLLGKLTVISKKDWDQLFKDLGVDDPPKWIYKGYNWKDFNHSGMGLAAIVNDIWKSAWKEFEKLRLQNEAQAEMMKNAHIKQQAAVQSKSARTEQMRKSSDKGVLYHDSDFDR